MKISFILYILYIKSYIGFILEILSGIRSASLDTLR